MSTPTPRTDQAEMDYAIHSTGWGKPFDLARTLERELDEMTARHVDMVKVAKTTRDEFIAARVNARRVDRDVTSAIETLCGIIAARNAELDSTRKELVAMTALRDSAQAWADKTAEYRPSKP